MWWEFCVWVWLISLVKRIGSRFLWLMLVVCLICFSKLWISFVVSGVGWLLLWCLMLYICCVLVWVFMVYWKWCWKVWCWVLGWNWWVVVCVVMWFCLVLLILICNVCCGWVMMLKNSVFVVLVSSLNLVFCWGKLFVYKRLLIWFCFLFLILLVILFYRILWLMVV